MIIKILSSSGTFAGVNYNEDKVAKGTAQLLAAENFGMLYTGRSGIGDTDYKGYFQSWSKSEDGVQTVKQPQFHTVISCEGREKSALQLHEIAAQYLQKMGYGDTPYLIYFHSDTANNHVHLVSSRVNRDGKKIDDSFERIRSQKVIKEILMQDIGEEIKAHVSKALGYSFSTPSQFKMLLEGNGVKVGESSTGYRFIKYGSVTGSLNRDTVDGKIAQYAAPEERIRQLRALFAKYKPGFTPEEFPSFLQSKFGVELVFHHAKGKQEPYGYSIIDHAQKQVLKGSQVMNLSELQSAVSREDKMASAQAIIDMLSSNQNLTYASFNKQLSGTGFTLSREGEVKISGEAEPAFKVDAVRMKELHYNERLLQAKSFAITSLAEARLLAKAFYLTPGSLAVNGPADRNKKEAAADTLGSMLGNGKTLQDILESNKWSIAHMKGEYYLIDQREKVVHKLSELTEQRLAYNSVDVLSFDSEVSRSAGREEESFSGSFGEMFSMLMNLVEANSSQEHQEVRKLKRKIRR